jgi:MoaA/NifB/PqqE/SkfB family radical SAM enzyme
VFIEVTNRCNLACATCVRSFLKYEPFRDLTVEEFEAIAGQFPTMERAVLHGLGEPLLNRNLPVMIRHLRSRGVSVLFNSNGTLLSPDWQKALVRSGLDEVRISLDTPDPERYERMRGKPLVHHVIENVRGLVATKTALGVDQPRISFWAIGTKETLPTLADLVRLAADAGVPEVYVQRLTFAVDDAERYGTASPEHTLFGDLTDPEGAVIDECQRLSRELGVAFQASGATDPAHSLRAAQGRELRPWSACVRPWTTAYITVAGNVLPCCMAHWADTDYGQMILGNIWEKDFRDIWNDAPYRAWRAALLSDTPNRACSGCGVDWSL